MCGRSQKGSAWTLASAIVCATVSFAAGQDVLPVPVDGPYSPTSDTGGAVSMWASDSSHDVASSTDQSVLTAQVADLAAKVQRLTDAEAKAKTQAAKKPSIAVGGRIMADWANFSQNETSRSQAGNFENGTEIRRARVFLKGDIPGGVDYKLQFELASLTSVSDFPGPGQTLGIGQVSFKDVYVTFKELPVPGDVRIGHFKTPFGLENLTSHRFSTFIERAMVSEGEIEGRRTGAMAFGHSESELSTWAIGVFTSQIPENPPIFKNDSGGAAIMTRHSFLPWYDEADEGRRLIHTAVSYSYADIARGNIVRFAERPESHLANAVIDTGRMTDVANINALGVEAALVHGPFSAQAEFVSFWVDRTANPSPLFHGAYGYVSYFLTGESRQYNRSRGYFDRTKPSADFLGVCDDHGHVQRGKGAWEIAYRYSYMDLNDNGVNGGLAANHTLGVNWYLNPYTRVMCNYLAANTTGHPDAPGTGHADIVQMRVQVDF